jgi:pyruvyltransferase
MQDQLTVSLRYWNRGRNIGDAINPYVVEFVSGCVPSFCYDEHAEHVLGIGSVFFMATKASHVWGAGVLDPRRPLDNVDSAKIHAVRGVKTLELLRSSLGFRKDIPLGDPGMLVDELISPRSAEKTYSHCVVPHHAFVSHPYFVDLSRTEGGILLDPRTDRLDFVEKMSRAEMVISQSLHGLIFATSLNIPCVWIAHTADEIWTFKFWDWFSNTDDPPRAPMPLGTPLKELRQIARPFSLRADKSALRGAFPGGLSKASRSKIGFRESRACAPYVVGVSFDSRAQPSLDLFSHISLASRNERELQMQLNKLSGSFHDLPPIVLVFDEAVYQKMTFGEFNALRRVLDEQPDLHYVSFHDAHERGGLGQDHGKSSPFVLRALSENLRWNGVLFVRHGINFSFSAPGLAAFRSTG